MAEEQTAPKPGKPGPKAQAEAKPASAPPSKPAAAAPAAQKKTGGKLAVIRIRNVTGAGHEIRDTLMMLRLAKKMTCSVIEDNPGMRGMLKKVKDYVTFGEVSADTIKMLEEKRGVKGKDGKVKPHFHLHPPRGGFERKGIKHSFNQGGALGYRGEKMNDLIKKMI